MSNSSILKATFMDPVESTGNGKHHQTMATKLDSQKLALDFATEVATDRLAQITEVLTQYRDGGVLPVDALFTIRELSGKKG